MLWSRRGTGAPSATAPAGDDLQALLDVIDDPVVVLRPDLGTDGRVIGVTVADMNTAALAATGLDSVPRGRSTVGWSGEPDLLRAAADRAWTHGVAAPCAVEVVRGPDRSRHTLEVRTIRLGEFLVQVGVPTDGRPAPDTEQRRGAAVLEGVDEAVLVLEAVRDGSVVIDARILFANRACQSVFLIDDDTLAAAPGTTLGGHYRGSPSQDAILEILASAVAGETASFDIDNTLGDHPMIARPFVRFTAVPIPGGTVLMLVRDTTATNLAVRRAARLSGFVDAMWDHFEGPVLSVRSTADGVVVERINAAAAALGADPSDALGAAVVLALRSGLVVPVESASGPLVVTPVSDDRALVTSGPIS